MAEASETCYDRYMIRFATKADIPAIMQFIDTHWKKDHILARDRAFFEYQYVTDEHVTFVVSECDNETDAPVHSLNGILGYIPYDRAQKNISLALWKALKSEDGMVGLQLLDYLQKQLQPDIIATPGVDPDTTRAIYKLFRYEVGIMRHFYRLMNRPSYRIAAATDATGALSPVLPPSGDMEAVHSVTSVPNTTVTRLTTFDEYRKARIFFAAHAIPKEDRYIEKRYFNHPVYAYEKILVRRAASDALLIIARVQEAQDSACLRIVDLIGDYSLLSRGTAALETLCTEYDCEYIDCYAAGIAPELFEEAGFTERPPVSSSHDGTVSDAGIVIPNHFAPFEQKNVDIWYSCLPAETVILRGDGDQDRPS